MERKAVCIDWSGTLSTSKFWEQLDQAKFDLIQNALFAGELKHLLNPWMLGQFTSEEVVKALSSKTEIDYEELLDSLQKSCEAMQLVSPNVLSLVGQIRKRGIIVAIATDNMDTFTRWTVPAMQLADHFDAILNSYDLKSRKKDIHPNGTSKFFNQFIIENTLTPHQIILIDDSEDKENALGNLGIDYRRIEAGVGLVPALEKILIETKSSHP